MVSPLHSWQLDSLHAMGFGAGDVVTWQGGKARANVEKLYVSFARRNEKNVYKWLRQRAARFADCREDAVPTEKIYVSRSDAAERQVINESELFSALKSYGFELYTLSEMNYQEQVKLFWEAKCVVAPHGAGLANILYARVGMSLLELMPSRDIRNHFQRLSETLGINYQRVFCQSSGSAIVAEIDKILAVIDRL